MESIRSKARYFVLLIIAACVSAGILNAQEPSSVYKGTFTLPFETRWGVAVLPPGDYSFSLNSTSVPMRATVRGEYGTVMIPAESMAQRRGSDRSSLIVVRNSRRGVVRSLYVAELRAAFYFGAPKEETRVMAKGPELIQRVPVMAAGK